MTMLAQISAPHFVAGLIFENGVVVETAPILKYMNGWMRNRVRTYCRQKGWSAKVVV